MVILILNISFLSGNLEICTNIFLKYHQYYFINQFKIKTKIIPLKVLFLIE